MSRDLDSPKAASDFADEFDRQAELARENPELHALSRVPEAAAKGYRAFFVKRYLVLYKIDDDRVVIAHLFHQTQNYAKFFGPEQWQETKGMENKAPERARARLRRALLRSRKTSNKEVFATNAASAYAPKQKNGRTGGRESQSGRSMERRLSEAPHGSARRPRPRAMRRGGLRRQAVKW